MDPALATIVTVPGATPVTSPLLSMVATPAKLQNQLMLTPETGLPEESNAVAVYCCVPPTLIDEDIGEMEMLATLAVTVNVTGALVTPAAVAVI